MSRIVRLAFWKGKPRASVVFVHGLGGHVYDTWRNAADDNTFWPVWLAQDVEGLAVYSLAYEAPASNWLGTSMPLQDRAANILEVLLTEPGLRTGPIVFVCHSLGGLIIKKILLNLQQQAMRRPEAGDLLERITEIVFASTPHTGASHATWLDRLRFLTWPSSIARILVANDPGLRDINVAYRGLADDRRSILRHRIFYETRGTPAGMIVDEASADPGLPGDPPVPIDADHISIVKPKDRTSLLYARVAQFVELVPAAAESSGDIEVLPLPTVRSDQPLNVVPKLIRIAALCLVAVIAFKGVQALITQPVDIEKIQRPLVDQLTEKDRQIKEKDRQLTELTTYLSNQRTTPPPPGADQELKKAVIAIDAGATIDSRYAQALDLLKAGKPSEAEPLLKAVAEDKERSAEDKLKNANNEKKDAAAAYRNLASIAAVSDPGRAREYYAKAAQLDPDNAEGFFWHGWYQFQSGKLDVAQEAYERVVKTAHLSDSHWLFEAQNGLGDIVKERGNLRGALRIYADNLAAADRMAKSEPGNAVWQYDLWVSLAKIGDVQVLQGDLPGALKSYRDALAIVEKLAKSDPGHAVWQRELSVFFERIGDVQKAQGDLPGALNSYRDCMAIRDKLTKSDPGDAGWQRDLSVSFSKIGDVQAMQGDLPGALKNYRDSHAIVEKLAKSDPGNAVWQRDLSISFNEIGAVQAEQGDRPGALKSFKDGLAIRDKLAKSDPGNADWQRDLSVSFNKVGDAHLDHGDLPGALTSYSDGLAIADKLAKSDPGNALWQSDLSISFERIGDVQKAQGDLSGALKSYGDCLAIRDKLATADPGNADWQHGLSLSFAKLAAVLKEQNDKAKAVGLLRQGRDIILHLTERSPENVTWKQDLDWFDAQINELAR